MAFHCHTVDGPTWNVSLVTLWLGGGSGPPVPPLDPPMRIRTVSPEPLLLVYWRVRKLSTPSPKDVDCILPSYMAYRSSNKTQFCSMVVHEHHKSDLSEGSDKFAHFARIQKVLSQGSDFDNVFFLVDEVRDDPNTTISGPTSARQRNAI